jgi:hypothetical protein
MVATIPEIQYVNGERRYMNIQKPGSALGVCRTPLKIVLIMVRMVTRLPAVCASGSAAMVICAKALA